METIKSLRVYVLVQHNLFYLMVEVYLHYYLRYNYMFRLLTITKTCSCTLGSSVNTPLPSNKISCVGQEHTLYSN